MSKADRVRELLMWQICASNECGGCIRRKKKPCPVDHALQQIEGIYKVDWEQIEKDLPDMLDVNVHGHINHPNPKKRKPVVSKMGNECSVRLSKAIVAYLKHMIPYPTT